MPRPIITVFGATGAQGGGLARAILADREQTFALRAVTRKPDGVAAHVLREAGAEVVLADLDDGCSVQRALEGAYGAFFVTNFWEHGSADKESSQAHTLAAAAAQAGLRHVVWSTLEDTRSLSDVGTRMPVLDGQYNVPHFDAKGAANRYFEQQRVPTTYLYTSCYFENLIHFGMGPQRRADGSLAVTLPTADKRIPWVAAEDIGRSAHRILLRGASMLGHSIGVAGDHLTGAELAAQLSEALGERVAFESPSFAVYGALPFPGAAELANMFQFKCDFEARYCAQRDLAASRALLPQITPFRSWLAQNKARLPLH